MRKLLSCLAGMKPWGWALSLTTPISVASLTAAVAQQAAGRYLLHPYVFGWSEEAVNSLSHELPSSCQRLYEIYAAKVLHRR